jgi:CMP-N-acetylneuraminic acid synthetase
MSIVAIIPARGGSKGLPKKNIKTLLNKPLIAHTIDVANKCTYIDRVIVSTDDEEIAEISKAYGAEVPFLRPENLANDTATTIDVLKHAISFLENEEDERVSDIVLLQPTSPLRTIDDLNRALDLYIENEKELPLISVCEAQTHPYLLKKIEGHTITDYMEKPVVTRRQDYPEVYELNGAIYICPKENIENDFIYKEQAIPLIMDKENSVDIDDEVDFLLAEAIITKRSGSDV